MKVLKVAALVILAALVLGMTKVDAQGSAQDPGSSSQAPSSAGNSGVSIEKNDQPVTDQPGQWVKGDQDVSAKQDVTTVGKAAARSREVLNWVLAIEQSGFAADDSSGSGNKGTAIYRLWKYVVSIVSVIFVLILIIIAFGLILRADWAEKSRRHLPAIIISFILTFASYAAGVTLIKGADRLQQSFYNLANSGAGLTDDQKHLRAENLLTVSFDYQTFVGYRRDGPEHNEAVKNHLRLVTLTTWTNYIVCAIIALRIIILWGLVIFSPFLFPFLIFPLTRNVAIVWLREYFRWLLLGPLFALFISAIPFIWRNTQVDVSQTYSSDQLAKNSGIPIQVNKNILKPSAAGNEKTINNIYQSGTNILLSPPGNYPAKPQTTNSLADGNNLSETDTYSRYLFALAMIWAAILLPFLLLRIIMGITAKASSSVSNVWNRSSARQYFEFLNLPQGKTPPPAPKPGPARSLPLAKFSAQPTKIGEEVRKETLRERETHEKEIAEKLSTPAIVNLSGLKAAVPRTDTLEGISEIEQNPAKLAVGKTVLEKIARPEQISLPAEAEKYQAIKESLQAREITGDKSAKAINNAILNNTTQYTKSDLKKQINQTAVRSLAQNIKNIYETNNEHIQNFQNTYNTNTSNLYEYLTQKATQNNDQNAVLALRAIEKIKGVSEIAENSTMRITDSEIEKGVKTVEKMLTPEKLADENEKREFGALKKTIDQGALSGNNNMQNLKNCLASIASITRDPERSKLEAQNSLRQLAQQIRDVIGTSLRAKEQDPAQKNKAGLALRALDKLKAAAESGDSEGASKAIRPSEISDPAERNEFRALDEIISKDKTRDVNYQQVSDMLEAIDYSTDSPQRALEKIARSDPDFSKSVRSWRDHYSKGALPASARNRKEYLEKETSKIQSIIDNFVSDDENKRAQAISQAQEVMPFLLLGDFPAVDVAKYFLAKLKGAKDALEKLAERDRGEEEGMLVDVPAAKKKEEELKTQAQSL